MLAAAIGALIGWAAAPSAALRDAGDRPPARSAAADPRAPDDPDPACAPRLAEARAACEVASPCGVPRPFPADGPFTRTAVDAWVADLRRTCPSFAGAPAELDCAEFPCALVAVGDRDLLCGQRPPGPYAFGGDMAGEGEVVWELTFGRLPEGLGDQHRLRARQDVLRAALDVHR